MELMLNNNKPKQEHKFVKNSMSQNIHQKIGIDIHVDDSIGVGNGRQKNLS
jgi:hypothetical protein